MKVNILKHIAILVGLPIIGFILLILVVALPNQSAYNHLYNSKEVIEASIANELIIPGESASLTGSFTDSLMLLNSVYKPQDKGIINQAMHMYRPELGDEEYWLPGESLRAYIDGSSIPSEAEYSRYWHGYIVILKPLLMLTSLSSIRLLSAGLLLLLIGSCLILLTKKDKSSLAVCMLIALPFMYYETSFASLSQSVCLYIILIAILILLYFDKVIDNTNLYLFLITGMTTSYFDFLTYPVCTLIFPLVVALSLKKDTYKKAFLTIAISSVEWGIGYIWMWASKWILADVLTDCTTISDALSTLLIRTGTAGDSSRFSGFISAISLNASAFTNWGFVLLIVVAVALIAIYLYTNKNKQTNLYLALPFICLSLIPFIWFFFTVNHSVEHWMFTCRILSATVFALGAGIVSIKGPKA